MRWKPHVRFGERAGETDQLKGWHRAPARLHRCHVFLGVGGRPLTHFHVGTTPPPGGTSTTLRPVLRPRRRGAQHSEVRKPDEAECPGLGRVPIGHLRRIGGSRRGATRGSCQCARNFHVSSRTPFLLPPNRTRLPPFGSWAMLAPSRPEGLVFPVIRRQAAPLQRQLSALRPELPRAASPPKRTTPPPPGALAAVGYWRAVGSEAPSRFHVIPFQVHVVPLANAEDPAGIPPKRTSS